MAAEIGLVWPVCLVGLHWAGEWCAYFDTYKKGFIVIAIQTGCSKIFDRGTGVLDRFLAGLLRCSHFGQEQEEQGSRQSNVKHDEGNGWFWNLVLCACRGSEILRENQQPRDEGSKEAAEESDLDLFSRKQHCIQQRPAVAIQQLVWGIHLIISIVVLYFNELQCSSVLNISGRSKYTKNSSVDRSLSSRINSIHYISWEV